MLHTDPEARTDPRLVLAPRAERFGAERARQDRRRRIAIVATLAVALVLTFAVKAWAWTASVQPSSNCQGTTFNGSVGNEPGSHTATVTFAGETKTVTVPAEGGNSFTLHFASHDGGPWSYEGTWSESPEVETASGTLPAVTDCEQEETPTPTTAPPVTQPPAEEKPPADKDDTIAGTATDTKRAEPTPDDSPELGTPPTVEQPGTLPFTGPREWLLPIGLFLVTAGGAMVLAGRRRYQQMTLAARAVDRAMHKPYRGPHERL